MLKPDTIYNLHVSEGLKKLPDESIIYSIHTSYWWLLGYLAYLECDDNSFEIYKNGMALFLKRSENIPHFGTNMHLHMVQHVATIWVLEHNGFYNNDGSRAADELKMKVFYDAMRKWTSNNNISMFYFEAFNEPWKGGESGSESHFGLFTVEGRAKYVLWEEDLVLL